MNTIIIANHKIILVSRIEVPSASLIHEIEDSSIPGCRGFLTVEKFNADVELFFPPKGLRFVAQLFTSLLCSTIY